VPRHCLLTRTQMKKSSEEVLDLCCDKLIAVVENEDTETKDLIAAIRLLYTMLSGQQENPTGDEAPDDTDLAEAILRSKAN